MSGGGGSKKKSSSKAEKADAVPSYLGGGVNSQFAQAMPGQLEAIASQLSAGYGAPVANNMSFLENLYAPMNIPQQASSVPVNNAGGGAGQSQLDQTRDFLLSHGIKPGRVFSRGGNR